MEVKITSPYGVKLLTAGKRCEEDITATIASSLLPSGELTVTENGTYDVYNKETVNVNVESSGGGLTINGIIEQYKVQAGKSVNAGDFVEFVKAVSWGSGTFATSGSNVSACLLNENTVLVAFSSSGEYPSAVVLKMTETDIIIGNIATKPNGTSTMSSISVYAISLIKLTENKALIAYCDYCRYGGSNYYGVFAFLVTVDGTTTTIGSSTQILWGKYSTMSYISAVALSENSVLLTFYNSDDVYGSYCMLTINDTKITNGSVLAFNTASTSYISAVALNQNQSKCLITYSDGGNSNYGTAIILVASSKGSEYVFNSNETRYISSVVLNENKVLVAYGNSSSYYGTAKILTINGSSVTVGEEMVFNNNGTANISAVALNESKVLVTYYDAGNSGYGTAQILTINETTITAGAKTVFNNASTSKNSLVALSSSSALVFYNSTGGYYKGLTIDGTNITVNTEVGSEILAKPSETVINGIANTSGTAGETVEVYVPIPKGYTVTLVWDSASANGWSASYTADNGENGNLSPSNTSVTFTNVTSITLNMPITGGTVNATSTTGEVYPAGENIIEITEDQTITVYVGSGQGGGGN